MAFTLHSLNSTLMMMLLLWLLMVVSIQFTSAKNICIKLSKLEIPPNLVCKSITDDTNMRNSNKTCTFLSQIHISKNHLNTSIEEIYNATIHSNKEKKFLIKKFWPSDEKILDIVKFNISIDYTRGEVQNVLVDYYLISFHVNMNRFPQGQKFNPEGNNQLQKSGIEISFLNNCSLQSDILDEKGQKLLPAHNFTVVVNGLLFGELDIFVYKIRIEDHDFNLTTEPNANNTKKRTWYRIATKYWELWLSFILMVITVILSITSAIHWCYKAVKEWKNEKNENAEFARKQNLEANLQMHVGLPMRNHFAKLSMDLTGYKSFQQEFPLPIAN